MSDESQEDKTESATPQRLEKAREEGQLPRSKELTTFLMLIGGIGALWAFGVLMKDALLVVMRQTMGFERQTGFDTSFAMTHMMNLGAVTLKSVAGFFGALLILSLVAPALLGGWNFSMKAVAPKISKLNPIKGLAKIFSMQSISELIKAIAKSLLVGFVAYLFLRLHVQEIMDLSRLTLETSMASMVKLVAYGCGYMALALIVVVLMDVPYQLFTHFKQLRMSKEEIKKEHKESEGDPHLKAKIKQQQQAIARSRMMTKVPTADVIITNPTHFAVALHYVDGESAAPKVVAKGADAVAARIRELGTENRVPLLEAPALARALFWHVELDQEIPENLYTAVAEVLAWVYGLKRMKEEGAEKPETPSQLEVPQGMDERPQKGKKLPPSLE
jgi:flagellar biosynthetic protein FlhB